MHLNMNINKNYACCIIKVDIYIYTYIRINISECVLCKRGVFIMLSSTFTFSNDVVT